MLSHAGFRCLRKLVRTELMKRKAYFRFGGQACCRTAIYGEAALFQIILWIIGFPA